MKLKLRVNEKNREPLENLLFKTKPLGVNILHGRFVRLIPLETPSECADCSAPASVTVVELKIVVSATNHIMGIARFEDVEEWYWCGQCDIGG